MGKTRARLAEGLKTALLRGHVDEGTYEELEAALIQADVGVQTTADLVERMRNHVHDEGIYSADELYAALKKDLVRIIEKSAPRSEDALAEWKSDDGPFVTLVCGVNGSGKTTTAGKLAAKLRAMERTVVLGAADTFRAAAAEQLTIWAERSGATIIKSGEGADPASVAYDAVDAAVARGASNVIIDTAGRLHNKVNLMEELKKIQRVVSRRIPGAPHEVLLVLDATTGQNGLQQARIFTEALTVTGITLTKLDGTAKGGMAISIQRELGIPIKFVGVGEKLEDLQPFNPKDFASALFD
jgi:fused signal recognition particle receptor